MDLASPTPASGLASGWQMRRGGTRVYVCCCPLALLLAPVLLFIRLVHYGLFRLLGRPVIAWWDRPSGPAAAPAGNRAEPG